VPLLDVPLLDVPLLDVPGPGWCGVPPGVEPYCCGAGDCPPLVCGVSVRGAPAGPSARGGVVVLVDAAAVSPCEGVRVVGAPPPCCGVPPGVEPLEAGCERGDGVVPAGSDRGVLPPGTGPLRGEGVVCEGVFWLCAGVVSDSG
jgi:hypothetical protein